MNDVDRAGGVSIERHEIERRRRGFWYAISAAASYPIRKVQSMPDLERPVADPQDLPENAASWVSSSAAMWIWAWKTIEYKVDPMEKGFAAWVRLILSILLWIGLPTAFVVALLYTCTFVVVKLSGLAGELVRLMSWLMVGGIAFIVLVLLGYLVYAVVMTVKGKEIDKLKIRFRNPDGDGVTGEDEDEGCAEGA